MALFFHAFDHLDQFLVKTTAQNGSHAAVALSVSSYYGIVSFDRRSMIGQCL